MLINRNLFRGLSLCLAMGCAHLSSASGFGTTVLPGETLEIWQPNSYDCGFQFSSIRADVDYQGRYSGVVALSVDGVLVDKTHIAPNQKYVNLHPYGSFNVLCEDVYTIGIMNIGSEPIHVGGSKIFLGARKR